MHADPATPYQRIAHAISSRAPDAAARLRERADPRRRMAEGVAAFDLLVGDALPRLFGLVPEGAPIVAALAATDYEAVRDLRGVLGATGTPEAWEEAFLDLRASGVVAAFVGSAAWAPRAAHRAAWLWVRPAVFDALALAKVRGLDVEIEAAVTTTAAAWARLP